MKKYLLFITLLLISIASFAQDENNKAFNAGEFIGKYVLLPVIVLIIIIWLVRRNKKPKQ